MPCKSLLAGLCVLAAVASSARAQIPEPRIEIEPKRETVAGEPIAVRVVGLPAERNVILSSQMIDRYGRLWLSEAEFRSTPDGTVDPAKLTPINEAW